MKGFRAVFPLAAESAAFFVLLPRLEVESPRRRGSIGADCPSLFPQSDHRERAQVDPLELRSDELPGPLLMRQPRYSVWR